MSDKRNGHGRRTFVDWLNLLLLVSSCLLFAAHGSAQTTAPLTIVSPPMNSVVAPGQHVVVEVSRSMNSGIVDVALHAVEWSTVVNGPDPLLFDILIPPSTPPGKLNIIAFDVTQRVTPGIGARSAPLVLSIESTLTISKLSSNFQSLRFRFVGDSTFLTVTGLSDTGELVALKTSSRISFASQNTSVATVAQSGLVTAVGPGNTTITATYNNPDGSIVNVGVPVSVPTLPRGDLDGNGKVDAEDLGILLSAIGTPATRPHDARDLNDDGLIDELDATVLKSLCAQPNCSTSSVRVSPTVTWSKPADINFGTALGAGQLSATASVPGTFVYSPSAGTVLPVGNREVLSARFTPADTATYSSVSTQVAINVLPGADPSVKIIVTSSFSRDSSNNILVQITLANAGLTAADTVTLTGVKIGTLSGAPLPQTVGTISANSLVRATSTVSGTAGAPGAASSFSVTGTYAGGSFSVTSRIALP